MQSSLAFRRRTTKQPRLPQTFSDWCVENAAGLILSLELNADIVHWIVAVMRSSGEMRGIENITTFERVLKHRRTLLRFPFATEFEWERVMLTGRVLLRAYENGVVS